MHKSKKQAVVLIDPVSSGRFLKEYVLQAGFDLIGVFTLSDAQLAAAGKRMAREDKLAGCDIVIDSRDCEDVLQQLCRLPYEIAAVIPGSEPGVEMADRLAAALALIGNDPATSAARRDKAAMRAAVRAAGLAGPEYAVCNNAQEAVAFAHTRHLPVIVKTPRGAGAHLVFVCHDIAAVAAACDRILSSSDIFGYTAAQVLVEDYIQGQQYFVEMFGDGRELHLTALWRTDFRHSATGIEYFSVAELMKPKDLPRAVAISEYARAVARAVGLRHGPCLVEVRDEPGRGPLLIEIGCRLGGLDLPWMEMQCTDFNPFAATVALYTDPRTFRLGSVRQHKSAALVFCPVDETGVIKQFAGLQAISELASHLQSKLHLQPGARVSARRDMAEIPLFVYLAHEDRAQVLRDIESVRKLFRVRFEAETRTLEQLSA